MAPLRFHTTAIAMETLFWNSRKFQKNYWQIKQLNCLLQGWEWQSDSISGTDQEEKRVEQLCRSSTHESVFFAIKWATWFRPLGSCVIYLLCKNQMIIVSTGGSRFIRICFFRIPAHPISSLSETLICLLNSKKFCLSKRIFFLFLWQSGRYLWCLFFTCVRKRDKKHQVVSYHTHTRVTSKHHSVLSTTEDTEDFLMLFFCDLKRLCAISL